MLVTSVPTHREHAVIDRVPPWRDYRDELRGEEAWALPDFRGTGLSGRYSGAITVEDLARDIQAVADELGERPLIVIAFRGGGAAAVEFARTNEDRIACLFIDEPSVPGLPPAQAAALEANWEEGWYVAARASYDWSDEGAWKPIVAPVV